MTSNVSPLFKSSPDWEKVSNDPARPELALKLEAPPNEPFDVPTQRARLAESEAKWSAKNPPEKYGYETHEETLQTRDGATITVKIYSPVVGFDSTHDQIFPLLFIAHAGGFTQGSPVTEEIFLLQTLWQHFKFLIVSVCFRYTPEYRFPIQLNDCEDALNWSVAHADRLHIDSSRLYLAASSAGGNLAASLAHIVRDEGSFKLSGVLLNVSTFCHPDHFPEDVGPLTSYDECFGTLLNSAEMRQVWELYLTDSKQGSDPRVSPLLGNLSGLPPHYIFVAGQDPVRDEGIAYAKKLKDSGVEVVLKVYPGVPHEFAEFDELETTQRFRRDLVECVEKMLKA